ncbi:hypothetical protein DPMN_080443 [Dreissena polymorpha]|uniref:Uncharacterized protein n=1 Tax=Dreissena polymorpha TaxID=45954 RepID=A0A9D3YWE3_DREPO|nr:hypothetical protein DPMN_080443 [Dreissena polymorpha]
MNIGETDVFDVYPEPANRTHVNFPKSALLHRIASSLGCVSNKSVKNQYQDLRLSMRRPFIQTQSAKHMATGNSTLTSHILPQSERKT